MTKTPHGRFLDTITGSLLEEQIRTINRGDDSIFIHPDAIVAESAVIEGPCYIGPNVVIRHGAYLRGELDMQRFSGWKFLRD